MPKNNLQDLRNHLFAQLERLDDDDLDLDQEIKKANAVAQIAGAIVNSAKIEVSYLKLAGRGESKFLATDNIKTIEINKPKQIANFSHADACIQTATSQGHTAESARNCENYSVGCTDCPFS